MTDVESKISWPEKVMLLMTDVRTWFGVPIKMASVLELFSCNTFCFIHAFISYRQVVKMENGMTEDGVDPDVELYVISVAMKKKIHAR